MESCSANVHKTLEHLQMSYNMIKPKLFQSLSPLKGFGKELTYFDLERTLENFTALN